MIFAARVETLWTLGRQCFPQLMAHFGRLRQAIGTPDEAQVLEAIYQTMPAQNISYDLLQRSTNDLAVIELTGVLWSDWGKPERVTEALQRIGLVPAFPLEYLNPI